MTDKEPLPPIEEEAFDGEKQQVTIPKDIPRCSHSKVKLVFGELRCPQCNASWMGPNLHKLYAHFTK